MKDKGIALHCCSIETNKTSNMAWNCSKLLNIAFAKNHNFCGPNEQEKQYPDNCKKRSSIFLNVAKLISVSAQGTRYSVHVQNVVAKLCRTLQPLLIFSELYFYRRISGANLNQKCRNHSQEKSASEQVLHIWRRVLCAFAKKWDHKGTSNVRASNSNVDQFPIVIIFATV